MSTDVVGNSYNDITGELPASIRSHTGPQSVYLIRGSVVNGVPKIGTMELLPLSRDIYMADLKE